MAKAGIFRDTRTEAAQHRGGPKVSARLPAAPEVHRPRPSPSTPQRGPAPAAPLRKRNARPGLSHSQTGRPRSGPTRTCAPGRGLRGPLRGARAPGSPGLKRRGHATSGTNGLPAPGSFCGPAPARPGPGDHREARPPRSLEGPERPPPAAGTPGPRHCAPPQPRGARTAVAPAPRGAKPLPAPGRGLGQEAAFAFPAQGQSSQAPGHLAKRREPRRGELRAQLRTRHPAGPRPLPAPSSASAKAGWEPAGPGPGLDRGRGGLTCAGGGDPPDKHTQACSTWRSGKPQGQFSIHMGPGAFICVLSGDAPPRSRRYIKHSAELSRSD
ncbi:uncharacterized protein [Vulpes vulpes]|uniref:Basic proline-rich protein-like n=1 Tax=Vulpes vulpes TaxID=9627 RepID=A0ABM5AVF7_VULVU